jgi:ribosomal protein L11 methyltransferase
MSTWETSVHTESARCEAVEEAMEAALGEMLQALSQFEDGAGWRITAHTSSEPDTELLARLDLALQRDETVAAPIKVPDQDWVAKVQRDMPPIRAGRFWIHGSHVTDPGPLGTNPIRVDAASAFGTGHHESTKGCLLMLDRLGRHLRPRRILDIGTGTGILAIAAAKTWRVPVLASDYDPEAIRVANRAVRQNGVGQWVNCAVATGATGRAAAERGPFDLILANILAGPLTALAPAVARNAAPGGHIVLSGILASQANQVVAAYRFAGFCRTKSITLGDWITLGFLRP